MRSTALLPQHQQAHRLGHCVFCLFHFNRIAHRFCTLQLYIMLLVSFAFSVEFRRRLAETWIALFASAASWSSATDTMARNLALHSIQIDLQTLQTPRPRGRMSWPAHRNLRKALPLALHRHRQAHFTTLWQTRYNTGLQLCTGACPLTAALWPILEVSTARRLLFHKQRP